MRKDLADLYAARAARGFPYLRLGQLCFCVFCHVEHEMGPLSEWNICWYFTQNERMILLRRCRHCLRAWREDWDLKATPPLMTSLREITDRVS